MCCISCSIIQPFLKNNINPLTAWSDMLHQIAFRIKINDWHWCIFLISASQREPDQWVDPLPQQKESIFPILILASNQIWKILGFC